MDKTMSALSGTYRFNGNNSFKQSLKTNKGKQILPMITKRDLSNIMTETRQSSLMSKGASKTTLNIMNVTFNSRPGVKQYINQVVRQGPSQSQLPKQGERQNKHNGYNNFYFSSQKRGTIQKFNMLDNAKKTKVQQNLLLEQAQKEKLVNKQSKVKLEHIKKQKSIER